MITVYFWDTQGIHSHSIEHDLNAALPGRCTLQAPPEVAGTEVAAWTGSGWTVLAERPEPPEPTAAYPKFTPLELLDLFTEAEQMAIVAATMSVPAVKLWYDRLIAATFVTYEDPRTEGGLQALVDAGLLTPQRKAEIVAAMQPEGVAA